MEWVIKDSVFNETEGLIEFFYNKNSGVSLYYYNKDDVHTDF